MDSGDRARLFDELSRLSPADFERLLVAVAMPRMNRAGTSAKIGAQVSALLEWADSCVGPGLSAIQDYLDKWKSGNLPPTLPETLCWRDFQLSAQVIHKKKQSSTCGM